MYLHFWKKENRYNLGFHLPWLASNQMILADRWLRKLVNMEGQNQHLDFGSLQLITEQLASANGKATAAEETVAAKSMPASDTQQLASSAPLNHTSNRRIVAPQSTEQAFPHSGIPTPTSDPVYRRSTASSIRSNQTANSLAKKSLLSFKQSKVRMPRFMVFHHLTRGLRPKLNLQARQDLDSRAVRNHDYRLS